MKKTYINPEMVMVPLMGKHMIANSVQSIDGLTGVTFSNEDFVGGSADVKGFSKTSIWDNEW